MNTSLKFRWAAPADYDALGEVMFDAARNGPSRYDEAQRRAWVGAPRSGDDWSARLAAQQVIIAETGGDILGFMSLAANGYLDFAYIRPGAQGTGLFRKMYDRIESAAIANGEARIWVHASLNAQSAFSAVGFDIIREETVTIGDQALDRFEMEKRLAPSGGR